jgi:hypothetical protein
MLRGEFNKSLLQKSKIPFVRGAFLSQPIFERSCTQHQTSRNTLHVWWYDVSKSNDIA